MWCAGHVVTEVCSKCPRHREILSVHTGIPLHHQRSNIKEEEQKEIRGEDLYLGRIVTETFAPKHDQQGREIFVMTANMMACNVSPNSKLQKLLL